MANDHVRENTPDKIQAKIDREINVDISQYRQADNAAIAGRIDALDREWDIERTLELNAALFALTGVLLAAFVNIYWLILPGVVLFFLAQHAIQGWCPPLPLFRKMGIKTRKELDREKYALIDELRRRNGA